MICALLLSGVALVVAAKLLWRHLVESGEEDERVLEQVEEEDYNE